MSVLNQLHNCLWLYWTVVPRMTEVECDTRTQLLTPSGHIVFVVAGCCLRQ